MPCRNIVLLVAFAGVAACGGNTDPNNKAKTELSPAPDNSVAAHMVTPLPGTPNVQPASQPAPVGTPPGFAGDWASDEAACKEPDKVYHFTASRIDMGAERGCAVTSTSGEHPTGRSMIYHVEGACIGEKRAENQAITFRFGASDTVMEVQVDDNPPERVVRCPPPQTPRPPPA